MPGDVRFDFTHCNFLNDSAVAVVGALARLIEARSARFDFEWSSLNKSVYNHLEKIGFIDVFGSRTQHVVGNSIPYREDLVADRDGIVTYLKTMWIGRRWVHVSPLIRDAIVGSVWEIYANAFEHASSPIGIMSCGQFYPRSKQLSLSVVDCGVGIPHNVSNFLRNPNMTGRETLEWAFQRGTTTKTNGIARGLGLDLLKDFVAVNKGKLQLYSHGGQTTIDENGVSHQNADVFFGGTLLDLILECDERYYSFASEAPDGPVF